MVETLGILDSAGVDGVFISQFLSQITPYSDQPRYDLDVASSSLVNYCGWGRHGTTYPGLSWEPKKALSGRTVLRQSPDINHICFLVQQLCVQKHGREPNSSGGTWEIEGLAAFGPNRGLKRKLTLFGQFVGDWDILEDRNLQNDGTWSKERGRIHWRWILDGRATQDVWSSIDEETGREIPWGTTIRYYDPGIDAWRSTWISPRQRATKAFIGRRVGEDIVLERKNEEGRLVRWIFSEITRNSFRWRAEESPDEGKSWTVVEEMKIRRRRE